MQRVFHADASGSTKPAAIAQTTADGKMRIEAVGPGSWEIVFGTPLGMPATSRMPISLTVLYWAGAVPDLTDLTVKGLAEPTVIEVFDNLSSIPSESGFYENQINGLSHLVTVEQLAAGRPASSVALTPHQG